jgi:hypothetical protein
VLSLAKPYCRKSLRPLSLGQIANEHYPQENRRARIGQDIKQIHQHLKQQINNYYRQLEQLSWYTSNPSLAQWQAVIGVDEDAAGHGFSKSTARL